MGPGRDRELPPARRRAGAGRRIGALHPRGAGPVRVPRHRPRGARGATSGSWRERCRAAAPAPGRARPRGGGAHHPEQRPADRARAGGDRADRAPVQASLPRLEYVDPGTVQIGLDCPRDVLDERIERRVRRMWGDGLVEEVRRLEAKGYERGSRRAGAGLPAGARRSWRGTCTEQEAYEADRAGHPPVRPATGLVVPQGPPDPLAALGRPGARGPRGSAGRGAVRPR